MSDHVFQIRQLADDLRSPDSGKQSIVLLDDANTKVVLLAFAAGSGLTEHETAKSVVAQIGKDFKTIHS